MGIDIYKNDALPCIGLKKRENIYSCELMELAPKDLKWFLFLKMGVGFGCNNWGE